MKSPRFVPTTAMLEKLTATMPAFVTVSVNGLLVLEMFSFPKDKGPGEKPRALPTPLKLTVVGLLGSESTTLRRPALSARGGRRENREHLATARSWNRRRRTWNSADIR